MDNMWALSVSMWAVLFVVLLVAVCVYVAFRWGVRSEHRRMEAQAEVKEREWRRTMDESKRRTLEGVSQRLMGPATLVVGPLQQLTEEGVLSAEVRPKVEMVLRSAQLLLHQVNLLPVGGSGPMIAGVERALNVPVSPTPNAQPSHSESQPLTSDSQPSISDSQPSTSNSQISTSDSQPSTSEEDGLQADHEFTLLMVDDSADMCRFVRDYFRREYRVLTAPNGERALQVLEQEEATGSGVDVVVSDVAMPKMDGLELCRRVKTDLRWSHIPVILLTGRRAEETEVEGLKMGADDYITKPFNVEMLRLRVKKLVEKRESRQRQWREKADVEASEITITSVDEQFIQQAMKVTEERMADTEFSVEVLGHELGLSRTYLYKKLVNITGKGPAEFIRTIRMKRAKQLLEQTQMQMTEIATALGYSSPKRFTENFKAEFGISPSEYARRIKKC